MDRRTFITAALAAVAAPKAEPINPAYYDASYEDVFAAGDVEVAGFFFRIDSHMPRFHFENGQWVKPEK